MLWSLVLLAVIVLATRRLRPLLAVARGRVLLMLAGSATLIAINWFVYIWAVDNAHLVEASLGYFINPLVNVALGTLLLHERLGLVQAIASAFPQKVRIVLQCSHLHRGARDVKRRIRMSHVRRQYATHRLGRSMEIRH